MGLLVSTLKHPPGQILFILLRLRSGPVGAVGVVDVVGVLVPPVYSVECRINQSQLQVVNNVYFIYT